MPGRAPRTATMLRRHRGGDDAHRGGRARRPVGASVMLRRMHGLPSGLLGVEAIGRVTPRDYVEFLGPLLEEQQRTGQRVRFLYHLGPEFRGFTAAGIVNDLRLGHRYAEIF